MTQKSDNVMLGFYIGRIVFSAALPIVVLSSLGMLTPFTFAICCLLPLGIAGGFLYYMFKDSFTNDKKIKAGNSILSNTSYQHSLVTHPSERLTSKVVPGGESEVTGKHPLGFFSSSSASQKSEMSAASVEKKQYNHSHSQLLRP